MERKSKVLSKPFVYKVNGKIKILQAETIFKENIKNGIASFKKKTIPFRLIL